ncbi:Rieske (2Fe-2S) protein [Streptomyces sp. NRRL S-340]|uniref:Rieske (2Fe-2S) protein n=1 Tax=Streptomyces sp. NRRL S-340 TaxID=1463901 RepID=UPI000559C1C2|nr:Rieske (2Fe-2S) protein [Streptomyces sp. NRRL S-340]
MTSASNHPQQEPARRTVVAALGAAGIAVTLTACGADGGPVSGASEAGDGPQPGASGPSSSGSSGAPGPSSAGSPGTGAGAGGVLARASDIPEGGGRIFADRGVVVTQPEKGRFEAFSSACTHQGCTVSGIADGVISCPCHGSEFSVTDGSVRKGPATRPLPARRISVHGDEIELA